MKKVVKIFAFSLLICSLYSCGSDELMDLKKDTKTPTETSDNNEGGGGTTNEPPNG